MLVVAGPETGERSLSLGRRSARECLPSEPPQWPPKPPQSSRPTLESGLAGPGAAVATVPRRPAAAEPCRRAVTRQLDANGGGTSHFPTVLVIADARKRHYGWREQPSHSLTMNGAARRHAAAGTEPD